ncbi:ketopantoate reductase PanE/ApbA C terminal-domain-containing protein [Amylocystis lapponica]|nr:ketopantoate reductase PanE/ApbA C terminal-domain-containing protein [Amylocystis lapponica]
MAAPLKDVLLVGLGAVGAIYSLVLKRSGMARVTVVARSNYDVVNAHGLHFQSKKYGDVQGWRPDRLFPNVAAALDRPYAYVVVTTKAIPEIIRTPTLLAPLLSPPYSDAHPQPTYVLMQNGLNVEKDLYAALQQLKPADKPRMINTTVWIGTGINGNVVAHGGFDRVSLGVCRPSATVTENTPEEAALLEDFARMLVAGGSEATVVPEIQRLKYAKNFWNAVLGVSAALTRHPLAAFFRAPPGAPSDPVPPPPGPERTAAEAATADLPRAAPAIGAFTLPWVYAAMREMEGLADVLFGAGALDPVHPDVARDTLARTAKLNADPANSHRASTLVDVERGRPTEVEVMLGELVRMGREHGVDMPRIETLYALMLVIQNQLLSDHHEKRAAP